jgi:hypothetical protein
MQRKTLIGLGGASMLATSLAPALAVFDAREARAQGAPYAVLTAQDAAVLESLGDVLVPGARGAGLTHFIDHELASEQPRLFLRFSQLPEPLAAYYASWSRAFTSAVQSRTGKPFAALDAPARHAIVEALRGGTLAPWNAPAPAALFYTALRLDAVDVVYGTIAAFERLGMPYMPHIAPKTTW